MSPPVLEKGDEGLGQPEADDLPARTPPAATDTHYKSKTLATWLAILGGLVGLHRFYLYGLRDVLGWLHPLPSAAGLIGIQRLSQMGQDDATAWLLAPVFGLMLALAMGAAIVYALTPDERWDARHNAGHEAHGTAWGPVLGAVLALLVGGAALMSSIAYAGQKFFEWQLQTVSYSVLRSSA